MKIKYLVVKILTLILVTFFFTGKDSNSFQISKKIDVNTVDTSFKKYRHTPNFLLHLAKYYIDIKDFKKAEIILRKTASCNVENNLKNVVFLRLARVQLQLKERKIAWHTINQIGFNLFDLKGDVLLQQGKNKEARKMWLQGIKNSQSFILKRILLMKISNSSF